MKSHGAQIAKAAGGGLMVSAIGALAAMDHLALALVVGVLVLVVLAMCWVVADFARSSNLALLIRAFGERRGPQEPPSAEGVDPAGVERRGGGRRAGVHA
ncbi:hypothetical protein Airi01_087820 [Actinoallomurus iriomotensis]|uniref:Uncharacterized protein n=1 Tax=Actinoallomurus iriomotensis TaxID=478107 RepID=A0A9W6RV83_9ACTN|nr:hypothetical protein Airi01_087820 [Actinoallomurus iriomotensis]